MATTPSARVGARRRRSDGERSRAVILDAAARLASVEGLNGLSIGRLADHVGMSKSGLYAHFDSKQDLQLATIATAEDIFRREVFEPVAGGQGGRAAVLALADAFLAHVARGTFPGGCFFAAASAEFDSLGGPIAARVRAFYGEWLDHLDAHLREAVELGELAETDLGQLAFEVDALLLGANAFYVLFGEEAMLDRGRRAVRARLGLAED